MPDCKSTFKKKKVTFFFKILHMSAITGKQRRLQKNEILQYH